MHLSPARRFSVRTPWPWYSDSRSGGGWFVKLNDVHHPLGKHPANSPPPRKKVGKWVPPQPILDTFYQLMSVRDTASKDDYSVAAICGLYLEELNRERPDLVKRYKSILGAFCDCSFKKNDKSVGKPFGKMLVNRELDTEHLEEWSRGYASKQTRRTYMGTVQTVFNWAVARKNINVINSTVTDSLTGARVRLS